jgi:hypothetical protein
MVAMAGGAVGANRSAERKVFVAHRATGVRVIPMNWLEAWRPSGFREATPSEVLGWYEERGTEPPSEVLQCVAAIAAEAAAATAAHDEQALSAITLPV